MSIPEPRVATELAVMEQVYRELKKLNGLERERAMNWVNARIAADGTQAQKKAETPDRGQ